MNKVYINDSIKPKLKNSTWVPCKECGTCEHYIFHVQTKNADENGSWVYVCIKCGEKQKRFIK